MPRLLHFDGVRLYRGKKLITSSKLKAAIMGDKSKFKNGRQRSVLTSLALIKTRAGIGRVPFEGKTEFVNNAVVSVQEHLTRKASTIMRDIMEDLHARSRSAHAAIWAENLHQVFTDLAFALSKSTKPSLVAMIVKADLRLSRVKLLLHRCSIYSTAYPKATWRDCFSFAIGTTEAAKLIQHSAPMSLEKTTKAKAFFSAACMNIITGVNSAFFVRAVELCIERKKLMLRTVGSHEDLVERLFTQIASPKGSKDKCISYLAETLENTKSLLKERDAEIKNLKAKLEVFQEEPRKEGDCSTTPLENDSKKSTDIGEESQTLEDGEILEEDSDASMQNLPPIPNAPISFIPSDAVCFASRDKVSSAHPTFSNTPAETSNTMAPLPQAPPHIATNSQWNAPPVSRPPHAQPNYNIKPQPQNIFSQHSQPISQQNYYPAQNTMERNYISERGPHTSSRHDRYPRIYSPHTANSPATGSGSFGRDHSYNAEKRGLRGVYNSFSNRFGHDTNYQTGFQNMVSEGGTQFSDSLFHKDERTAYQAPEYGLPETKEVVHTKNRYKMHDEPFPDDLYSKNGPSRTSIYPEYQQQFSFRHQPY